MYTFNAVPFVPCSIVAGSMSNLEQDGTHETSCQRNKHQEQKSAHVDKIVCLHCHLRLVVIPRLS